MGGTAESVAGEAQVPRGVFVLALARATSVAGVPRLPELTGLIPAVRCLFQRPAIPRAATAGKILNLRRREAEEDLCVLDFTGFDA
jgi:hypothetical protein